LESSPRLLRSGRPCRRRANTAVKYFVSPEFRAMTPAKSKRQSQTTSCANPPYTDGWIFVSNQLFRGISRMTTFTLPGVAAAVAEKMIRKLRLGMMPPPGARRPDAAALTQFAAALEAKVDAASTLKPNPGRRPFQRLNRAEYGRSVHDLLDLDVDVNAFLPP